MDCKKMTFVFPTLTVPVLLKAVVQAPLRGGSGNTEDGGSNIDQTGGEGQGSESGSDGNMGYPPAARVLAPSRTQ